MDPGSSSAALSMGVKKQEDVDGSDPKSGQKPEQKPVVRTLNRVPRTCPFLSFRHAQSDRIHRNNSRCMCESHILGPPRPIAARSLHYPLECLS